MDYFIALSGAIVAGAINTLAGNGSAITLTILMEVLGLPPNVANGTNRVGVLGNGLAAAAGFYRGGRFALPPERKREMWRIVGITTVGALIGIYLSLIISNEAYLRAFRYLLVVMLLVILVKPKRWLAADADRPPLSPWLSVPLFLAIGIYGGFIQMGMGVFFLAVMVLAARYDIIQGNVVKALVVTVYTLVAVLIFAWRGLIAWEIGLLMAGGQMIGGFLTARLAADHPRAGLVAYWVLIVVIVGAIARAFL